MADRSSPEKVGVSSSDGKRIFLPKSLMAGSLFSCIFLGNQAAGGKGGETRDVFLWARGSRLALDVSRLLKQEVDATSTQEFDSQPQVYVASGFSSLSSHIFDSPVAQAVGAPK